MSRLEEKVERYNDTYNFGKVKGNSINTNATIQTDNLQQAYNEMQKDLEVLKEYEEQ